MRGRAAAACQGDRVRLCDFSTHRIIRPIHSLLSFQSPSTKASFLPCTHEGRFPTWHTTRQDLFSKATNADILTKQHKLQVSKEAATRTLQTTLRAGLSSAKLYCSQAKLILITMEELSVCTINKVSESDSFQKVG